MRLWKRTLRSAFIKHLHIHSHEYRSIMNRIAIDISVNCNSHSVHIRGHNRLTFVHNSTMKMHRPCTFANVSGMWQNCAEFEGFDLSDGFIIFFSIY